MKEGTSLATELYGRTILGGGSSGVILEIDEDTVMKVFAVEDDIVEEEFQIEKKIYDRIGNHPRFLTVCRWETRVLVFDRMKESLRHALKNLRQTTTTLPNPLVLEWALQMAQGLEHLHANSILQVDLGCHNILLDRHGSLKYCDFAGSSIDGSAPTVQPGKRSQYPTDDPHEPHTIKHELFAMGSALYELSTTFEPYSDMNNATVATLFAARRFPDTTHLLLGNVIQRCWHGCYGAAAEITRDVKQIRASEVATVCDKY